ncbi:MULTISPECIES: prolyl aminopeptidase [unclassified Streptomyces]|uniref:prolyl aminopeptidase n=1 Tax=unclassified Streptomyces TaxID=2593676 RepID=UPI001F337EF0|nr:prolyl aminopeptidase [Streptomyces sp. HmicA12]
MAQEVEGRALDLYPKIEPYADGMLDVGDGHEIYWETSGNPEGSPVLTLHGGPGSGSGAGLRRMWNPERYRIIQMDQRNCGRSTPSAADPAVRITHNTTQHLVADMERLREHLGVEQWGLWGGSWGTTLALIYAQTHPERVRSLLLMYMMLARKGDLRWLYQEMGRYFPEEWNSFRAGAGNDTSGDHNLLTAYNRLLNAEHNEIVQREAARNWCAWEDVISSLDPGWKPSKRYTDPDFAMQFARIVTHYFSNDAWLDENQILRNSDRLKGIPGFILHGREDRANPYDMAWLLAEAWPDAELVTISGVGHSHTDDSTALMFRAANQL